MATQAERQELWEQRRRQLMQLVGAGGARPQAGYFPSRDSTTAGGLPKPPMQRPGTMSLPFGLMPSDQQVTEYATAMGMPGPPAPHPAGRQLPLVQGRGAPNSRTPAGMAAPGGVQGGQSNWQTMLQQLTADQAAKEGAANAANQARYDEIHAGRTDLRDRVMGRVDNWGQLQGQLNEERAGEALKRQRAVLAEQGNANSTVLPAFMARSARDLAMVQQGLSEQVDNRAIGYDVGLSDELYDAVERRDDIGPDSSSYLAIAQQLGQAQALEASESSRRRGLAATSPRRNAPQIPYYGNGGGYRAGRALGGQQRAPVLGSARQLAVSQGLEPDEAPFSGDPEPSMRSDAPMLERLQKEFAGKQARIDARLEGGYVPGDAQRANTRQLRSIRDRGASDGGLPTMGALGSAFGPAAFGAVQQFGGQVQQFGSNAMQNYLQQQAAEQERLRIEAEREAFNQRRRRTGVRTNIGG